MFTPQAQQHSPSCFFVSPSDLWDYKLLDLRFSDQDLFWLGVRTSLDLSSANFWASSDQELFQHCLFSGTADVDESREKFFQ